MYTKPELMIEQFEVEDIITTSGAGSDTPAIITDPFEAPLMPADSVSFN